MNEKIILNLCSYKNDILKITEIGTYHNKTYLHILPKNMSEKNLLETKYFEDLKKEFHVLQNEKKIHRYFHHLNSSQALALNFFVPIIKEGLLSNFLGIEDEVFNTKFEYEFEHEEENSFEVKPYRKTNFDFYAEANNKKYFFEVKYTEKEFGSAKKDSAHKEKYKTIYKPTLEKICKANIPENEFFKNYQLWRNLCHVQYGTICFVLPSFRNDLIKTIENAKSFIKEEYIKFIQIRIIDDFVLKMTSHKNVNISNHYKEFKKKYFEL